MRAKIRNLFPPFLLVVVAASCTQKSIETRRIEVGATNFTGPTYSLPLGMIDVALEWDGKKTNPVVTPNDVLTLPDPDVLYALNFDPSVWAKDEFGVTVKNGLLSAVNATTTDQTGAALGKIIEIAAESAKLGALGVVVTSDGDKGDAALKPFKRRIVFDPFGGSSSARLANDLKGTGLGVELTSVNGKPLEPVTERPVDCTSSICFRSLTPIIVTIAGNTAQFTGFRRSFIARVPDVRGVGGQDLRRAPCIAKTGGVTLVDGVLETLSLTKPSEVVGCLEIPLDILKRIAAVPGELLTFRTETADAETKHLNAILALQKAEAATAAALLEAAKPAP